ncbi:MAG: Bax inhibitor-1/YccA family protein [Patescibacteria group bacterium]|nr:Bax inhibitor-1/YccA family protein [Patescibacteria group bacterium]
MVKPVNICAQKQEVILLDQQTFLNAMDFQPTVPEQAATSAPVSVKPGKPSWGRAALGQFSTPDRVAFIYKVYGWMCFGLMISALVSFLVMSTPSIAQAIFGNIMIFYGLLILELIAVFSLAAMVHKISSVASAIIFVLYSALNGLTLSIIFFAYQLGSIEEIFFLAAGIFGAMSLYGFFTKRDLTTVGRLAIMALFGLVVAMIVNLFIMNDVYMFILACIGTVVFVILTAYDTQKLKWLYELGRTEGSDGEKKEAINGALTLYLDFINLFVDLLLVFGKRK